MLLRLRSATKAGVGKMAAKKQFVVMIRTPMGSTIDVVIEAEGDVNARRIAEMQYGKKNVMSVVQKF